MVCGLCWGSVVVLGLLVVVWREVGVTNGMWTPVVAGGGLCWSNWLCVFEVALLIAVVMVE